MAIKSIGWLLYEPIAGDNTASWNAAIATGKPIKISNNGNTIQLATGASIGDRDLIIDAEGVLFETTANVLPFNITQSLGTAYAITGLDNVDYDATEDANPATSTVTRLTLSSGDSANIVAGEWYKIASEDVAPGGSTGEGPRMGEIVRVHSVDTGNGFVYLNGQIYREDLYVTTPTISRLNGQDYRINIQGARFRIGDAGVTGNWTQPFIWCQGAFRPNIDVHIVRGGNTGLFFLSNLAPRVRARIDHIHFAVGAVGGYGTWVSADCYGRYELVGSRCRHLFTDNWTNASAVGAQIRHGPMIGATVTGTATHCLGAGFDFHSSAYNCQMVNIASFRNITGRNAGLGCGFQLRGFKNRVIGAKTHGNQWGGQVFANSGTSSNDLIVEGLDSDDIQGSLLIEGLSSISPKMLVRVKGGNLRSSGARVIRAFESNIHLDDVTLQPSGQSGGTLLELGTASPNTAGNNTVRGKIKYDPRDAAGSWTLAYVNGTNEISVHTTSADADAAPGNADYTITDLTPDEVLFSTTLTADRAVSVTVQGRKKVLIRRTAGGAFNVNIAHAGGTLALAQNRAVWLDIRAGVVMLASPTMTIG